MFAPLFPTLSSLQPISSVAQMASSKLLLTDCAAEICEARPLCLRVSCAPRGQNVFGGGRRGVFWYHTIYVEAWVGPPTPVPGPPALHSFDTLSIRLRLVARSLSVACPHL